jgi:ArsR family transcriptional regulator
MTTTKRPPTPLQVEPSGPPEDPDIELARLAKALGHPVRVAIVRMLLEENRCVCGGIVQRLPLAQATVSQHLKVLKEAGLVMGELDPPRVCYCINRGMVERVVQLLDHMLERSQSS